MAKEIFHLLQYTSLNAVLAHPEEPQDGCQNAIAILHLHGSTQVQQELVGNFEKIIVLVTGVPDIEQESTETINFLALDISAEGFLGLRNYIANLPN